MSLWYRIFSASAKEPVPVEILKHLHEQGLKPESHFRGDDHGWFALEMKLESGSPIMLERWLVVEDEIRKELDAWAAFLETCDYEPNHVMLMERVVQSQQLFTLRKPMDHANELALETLCETLCQHLASVTEGIYQIDQQGMFDPTGTRLLQEY